MPNFFEIPYYHDYLSPSLARELLKEAKTVDGVPGLAMLGKNAGLETKEALRFLAALYEDVKAELAKVLAQRIADRKFIDERVAATYEFNREMGRDLLDPDYKTILGLEDASGRVVIGPKTPDYCRKGGKPVAPLPDFLKGPHVTLFGPPDSAKMAINAMNAYHRKLANEPGLVEELVSAEDHVPMWGADDEDSKTPLHADLVDAAVNLTGCFEGTLSLTEGVKKYELAKDRLSLPIKRFPGLALPAPFLFLNGNPIPLHLYDFALHLFRNWDNEKALVFYVPKLENEEEAAYIHKMIASAEAAIEKLHPEYKPGSVRLMIVLENPRAILRAHEIMDALYPYFAGASLGWHDYLASTARIFKNDANYRIPVKADPDIVIKYIKASHLLLAEAVGSRGGVKVGGMYGILPLAGNEKSLQVTLKGFIKDVVTQMKRNLTGFWVAHPDFVRLGLALVEAWKRRERGDPAPLTELVKSLMEEEFHEELLAFIEGPDIEGLDPDDPNYVRSLIVADIKESDFIPNNHPDEIRYNVFQSLQYLTDWLAGNGCVALPTAIGKLPVRVMDDLATAERSRWEVWHELKHGRFAMEDFLKIVHEEMNFIRKDLSDGKKIVQVKWDERTEKWYGVALKIMLKLMTAEEPPEFATELLLPFTVSLVRGSADPYKAAASLAPEKYRLSKYVEDFHRYFEICGSSRFAKTMAGNIAEDARLAEKTILSFSKDEIIEAASFHGDIGESKRTLDARAASEQAKVLSEEESVKEELRSLGREYKEKFGIKFLISAKGKGAHEILEDLKKRLRNTESQELGNARRALWEISQKRMSRPRFGPAWIDALRKKHGIAGAGIAINYHGATQCLVSGESVKGQSPVTEDTRFELASLSKTVASAFAIEYFQARNIPLSTPVDTLLERSGSDFRLKSPKDPAWASEVTLEHLMSHGALGMHYVKGIPADAPMPSIRELLDAKHGYGPQEVVNKPGTRFQYSGGGFMVLEHLIESLEKRPIQELTKEFLVKTGIEDISFDPKTPSAHGYFDSGKEVPGTRNNFPAFAAGALGTAAATARFLRKLEHAFRNLEEKDLSHDTAVQMLHGTDKGCRAFIGCDMGLGVFVAEAGANRLAIHQGANEGFRAIYIHCFQGPDRGKGFVIFCNGDNKGVLFIAELAQKLLMELEISGIKSFGDSFTFDGLPQEQIVNLGYKTLLFDAFEPDLPEEIVDKGPPDPLSDCNLAVKAKILEVTNQKFARAENLLSPYLPVFDPELFGRQGKIMDSWESARHNEFEYDTVFLELERPSEIRFLSLSTKYHDGNHAEFVRVDGLDGGKIWREILPKIKMEGHSLLSVDLGKPETYTHIKVHMYPDGGLSRLGLFTKLPADSAANFQKLSAAKCVRFKDAVPKSKKPLTIPYQPDGKEILKNRERAKNKTELANLALGGSVVRATNEHYGPAAQVISPFPPLHMFDGLESARSRKPGHHEEVVLRLCRRNPVERVVLDFRFFVNNSPLYVSLHGKAGGEWVELAPKTKVKAFAGNKKEFRIADKESFEELMVRCYPDGGINRIRVYGPGPAGGATGR